MEGATFKQGKHRIEGNKYEEEIRQLTDTINKKHAQRRKRVVKDYREHYFYHHPTWDIERQALGEEADEYVEPAIDLAIPERAELANILCFQPDNLNEDEILQRRISSERFFLPRPT